MRNSFTSPSFTIPAVHGGTAFSILVPQAISGVTVALSSKDGVDLAGPASQSGDRVRVYAPRGAQLSNHVPASHFKTASKERPLSAGC